jgi:Protein of unknown function (DUF4236)
MGFRLQKRLKIAPGVRLNLSKGVPSVSVGGHGLTANLSPRKGLTTTASIPGSGLSYRQTWNRDARRRHGDPVSGFLRTIGLLAFVCFVLLFSGLCSKTSTPTPKADARLWTPERIERSGIFKAEPTKATRQN